MTEERTINDLKKELEEGQQKCIICGDKATNIKMGKMICLYHWELANDHKSGRG